jgi:hypothetical protein
VGSGGWLVVGGRYVAASRVDVAASRVVMKARVRDAY